jgi:hypothetical protein
MRALLTSGVALGVHVPGLLLAKRLAERGSGASVEVLERLLPRERLAAVAASRSLFQRDFRAARAAQRLAADPSRAIDDATLVAVQRRWAERGVRDVVVFSGFWLGPLDRLTALGLPLPRITVCHVDAVVSPSFRRAGRLTAQHRTVWLASSARGCLPWTIPVSEEAPVPWGERTGRLLVHGGGWGMGTYRERAVALQDAGHPLDIIVHDPAVPATAHPTTRHHLMDPAWHPWLDDGFPPLGRLLPGQDPSSVGYRRGGAHHASFDLARTATAMVSKPGGGTLLDAFWSATPLVLLEPSGEHEEHNARLWCALGFGIRYDAWRASGFAAEPLRPLHEALLGARTGSAAPRDLAAALAAQDGVLTAAEPESDVL